MNLNRQLSGTFVGYLNRKQTRQNNSQIHVEITKQKPSSFPNDFHRHTYCTGKGRTCESYSVELVSSTPFSPSFMLTRAQMRHFRPCCCPLHSAAKHSSDSEKEHLRTNKNIDNAMEHGNKPYFHLLQRAKARMFVEEQKEQRRIGNGSTNIENMKEKTPEEEEAEFERKLELMIKEDEANALLNSPIRRPNVLSSQREFTLKKELFRRPGEDVFMRQIGFLFLFLVGLVALMHVFRTTLVPIWRYSAHEDIMWLEDLRDHGGIIIAIPGYRQDLYLFPQGESEKQLLKSQLGEEMYLESAGQKQRL